MNNDLLLKYHIRLTFQHFNGCATSHCGYFLAGSKIQAIEKAKAFMYRDILRGHLDGEMAVDWAYEVVRKECSGK